MSTAPPPPLPYATPTTPKSGRSKIVLGLVAIFLVVLFFLLIRQGGSSRSAGNSVSFGQFQRELATGRVRTIIIFPNELQYFMVTPNPGGRTSGSSTMTTARVPIAQDLGRDWRFIEWLSESRADLPAPDIRFASDQNLVVNLLLPLVPWLLIFGFLYFFVFRSLRQANRRAPLPVVIVNPEATQP